MVPSSKHRRIPLFFLATFIVGESFTVTGRPLSATSGASGQQAWVFRASPVAGFSHEAWAVHAPVSERVTRLPVPQRLKPQCSVMQMHPDTKPSTALVKVAALQPWRLVTEVSASKAKRQVIQQPPNPSFKRTRLRRSA